MQRYEMTNRVHEQLGLPVPYVVANPSSYALHNVFPWSKLHHVRFRRFGWKRRHGLKSWIEAAKKRLHPNVLAIALANKLARIAWGVLAHGRDFEVRKISEAAAQSA